MKTSIQTIILTAVAALLAPFASADWNNHSNTGFDYATLERIEIVERHEGDSSHTDWRINRFEGHSSHTDVIRHEGGFDDRFTHRLEGGHVIEEYDYDVTLEGTVGERDGAYIPDVEEAPRRHGHYRPYQSWDSSHK